MSRPQWPLGGAIPDVVVRCGSTDTGGRGTCGRVLMVAYRSPEVAIFVATADGDRFAEVRFKKFAAADPIDEEIIDPRSGEPTGDTKADLWQRDGPNEIFEKILRLREGDNSVRFRPTDIEPWRRYGPQRLTSGRDLPGTCRKHGDRGNCAEQLREAIEQTGRVIIPV